MYKVNFKYSVETHVYPELIAAVNRLCTDKKKSCTCTSGYRSIEKQKIINADSFRQRKSQGAYQLANGAVYTPDGKCWASAYGCSMHNYCIAMDIPDSWFEALTNSDLKKYGLVKSVEHEPWHVTLIKLVGISQGQKEAIRDSILKGVREDMTVIEFQTMTGLTADGVAGPKTKEKAKEVLQVCEEILGNNFNTPEETIKACMTKPDEWLARLETIPYFPAFIMNIVKKMGGKA